MPAVRSLEGVRVMAVEDEPDALALLDQVLKEAGAVVIAVASAEAALDRFEPDAVDVLISDIGMPGMDGYELIQRLRSAPTRARRGVPAIAVSAYARIEDGERALAAGYQRYLAKPLDVPELVSAVAELARSAR